METACLACNYTCKYLSQVDGVFNLWKSSRKCDLLGHFTFMFSRCCHPGAVCRGKFWFSFHGVETLWHFQCESTVSLHSSARFIRSALRQTTHHLTWRIYHLFSAFHKLENISEPHGCGRFSSYLWRIWTTVFLREKLDLNFKMRKNIAIFWDYMTLYTWWGENLRGSTPHLNEHGTECFSQFELKADPILM